MKFASPLRRIITSPIPLLPIPTISQDRFPEIVLRYSAETRLLPGLTAVCSKEYMIAAKRWRQGLYLQVV